MTMPDEVRRIQELIERNERRLHELRMKKATYGLNTPPEITIEIEDLEREQADLHAQMRSTHTPPLEPAPSSGTSPRPPASSAQQPAPEKPASPRPKEENKVRWSIWIPVIVALIGLVGLIFQTVWANDGSPASTPTLAATPAPFSYLVHVQDKSTGNNIERAEVTIEIGGKAPINGLTDSNGMARIFIPAEFAGQPGVLRIEAAGYNNYTKNMDISEGALPDIVQLESSP